MEREETGSGEGVAGLGEKVRGLRKSAHGHGQQNGHYQRERRREEVEGHGRRQDLGGEHKIQCTDDVSQNCTPEPYIIALTNATPINSIKRK